MGLALKNCRVLKDGKLVSSDVLIEGGKISKTGNINSADRMINCKGNILLPGLIDCHVHMREPGMEYKEGFLSGSRAALKGGVTTFLDMPNTNPPTVTVKSLEEKRKLARKSYVNYGFHFGVSPDNLDEIKMAKNIAGVKVYLNETTGNLRIDNMDVVKEAIKIPRISCFHAEGKNVGTALKMHELYRHNSNRIYFCHISRKGEMEMLNGKEAFVEVTPHHLFLTENDARRLEGFGLMKPTLGKKSDQLALWDGIKRGVVNTIATDHAPHTIEEKKNSNPPYGVPGIETMLPLLLNAVNDGKLRLSDIQRLCSENPARIFGIRGKGKITAGHDADLVLVDLKKKTKISNDTIISKCRWSPWDGKTLKGSVEMTVVNGMVGYKGGGFYKTKGREVIFS